jgi:hypothetical protein
MYQLPQVGPSFAPAGGAVKEVTVASIQASPPSDEAILSFHAQVDDPSTPPEVIDRALQEKPALLDAYHPKDGYTALIRTSRSGNAPRVRQFLDAGADPLKPERDGMLALAGHKAAFMGHLKAMKELVSVDEQTAKAMLEIRGPKNGKTILMDALWIERPGLPADYQIPPERLPVYAEVAELLIQRSLEVGADLNLKSHQGESARSMLEQLLPKYPVFQSALDQLPQADWPFFKGNF